MANLKIGTKVDRLYKLKELRRETKKKLDELVSKEFKLTEEIINELPKDKLEGAVGRIAKCAINKKAVPTVEDWPKFYKYILRNKATDMLQRRISSAAWEERIKAGKKVPGVKSFNKISLSITKKPSKK